MAVIALIITVDVIYRLASGISIVVTTVTQHGRSHELTIVMALVTLHVSMLAGEWESGGEMVVIREVSIRGNRIRGDNVRGDRNSETAEETTAYHC